MEGHSHFFMLRTIQVALVQHDCCRYIVHLTGHQKPVQKRKFDLREIQCHDKKGPVKISCDYMRLTRKIGRLSDDIVPARLNSCDDC